MLTNKAAAPKMLYIVLVNVEFTSKMFTTRLNSENNKTILLSIEQQITFLVVLSFFSRCLINQNPTDPASFNLLETLLNDNRTTSITNYIPILA